MGSHTFIALDFETYYDDQYSLRKMPVPNYIYDERFEMIMCAVQVDAGKPEIIEADDFPAWLSQFDPAHTSTVAFNAMFDNAILSYRYGFVPARMYCSMSMARALIGHKLAKGSSLAAVAECMKLPAKLGTLNNVKGMRAKEISEAGLWDEFCTYAMLDNQLNRGIFARLIRDFPESERKLVDLVIRCAVEPRFELDWIILQDHLKEIDIQKKALLDAAGVSVPQLMSTNMFKALLEVHGVTVEMKTSKSNGLPIPALAKTDKFMDDLLEHDDPKVVALAEARLGHKTTIEGTRSQKLLTIAACPWKDYRGGNSGTVPVPLGYGKTHTHRLAGEWGMNMQNLPSSRTVGSKLRKALLAPEGHTVVTADLGQIEARLNAWFCGTEKLLGQFARGEDPYAKMAETIFGYVVDRKVQKVEGFIGKTAILGLGYGCGSARFFDMVGTMARTSKIDLGNLWTDTLAQQAVQAYRRDMSPTPAMWRELDDVLSKAWLGVGEPVTLRCVEIGKGYVKGPNGLYLRYDNPRYNAELNEYEFDYGRECHKIYGAKLLENIIQFLARIIVMDAAIRIQDHPKAKSWGKFVLQAHDELVYIVPDALVKDAKQIIHTEMTRRPTWAIYLPLKADVGTGRSYGEAK